MMDWLDEYEEEGLTGAAKLQFELMRPFNVYDFARDPSSETFVKAMYMPTVSYLGYRFALAVTGETGVGFWTRQAGKFHDYKQAAKAVMPYIPIMAAYMGYYAVGSQVVAMPYRSVRYTSTASGGSTRTHVGGGYSFRNPISGM